MISTPHTAYWYLRDLGLSHGQALRLIAAGRGTFEYFIKAIGF